MSNTNTTINLNDTQNLDAKKQQANTTPSSQNISNLGSYLSSLVSIIITLVIYIIFGAITLYECKLAQSNILPTDLECYPYTETRPQIQQILTNIFITNTDPQQSVKLGFPYDKYNSKNMLLDMLRKYKEKSNSGFFFNYFIAVYLITLSENMEYFF
jgi:hypothetical protein